MFEQLEMEVLNKELAHGTGIAQNSQWIRLLASPPFYSFPLTY
jgi:hypothetical protein